MTNKDEKEVNSQFISLVLMLASACWQQLGKIPNPVSGKIEKQIEHANLSINMLLMLKDKTKGNLSEEENNTLTNILSDLELNYVEEIKKSETGETKH